MKITELIEKLEKLKEKSGDMPVMVMESCQDGDSIDLHGFSLLVDDDDKPIHVLLADKETMLAFS